MLPRFELENDLINRTIAGWDDLDWYAEANQWAAIVAARHGLAVNQVCGIIAALSPQRKWDINMRQTVEFIQSYGETYLHYGHQVEKARAIFHGADPDEVLTGPKEHCFYRNLIGDESTVTIDRHMLTAMGHKGKKLTPKRFAESLDTLSRLADGFGVAAPQVQAAIWSTLAA